MVTVYYSKGTQMEVSEEKTPKARSKGRRPELPAVLTSGVTRTAVCLSAVTCGNTREALPARDAHINPDIQGSDCRWQGVPT